MKLLQKYLPNPRQMALQLDFFAPIFSTQPKVDLPAPVQQFDTASTAESPFDSTATLAPLAPGKRRVRLDDQTLDYVLLRSKRRSIGFVIDDDGLRITSPKWVTLVEIDNAVREKQRWILNKLAERRERSARRLQPQMQWSDGGTLPYLGNDIILRIESHQQSGISFDVDTRELTICLPADASEQQLKDRVQSWLQQEAKRNFAERLPIYAEKLEVSFHSFKLSAAQTQWGSCTADGKIRLNWRLIHFAQPQIDYVIAHELSHLREMNHSPRFWATVQSIFPEFEAAKKILRDRTPETLPIF